MREGARCYWDWIFPALAGANEEFPVQILEMEHLITDQVTDREDRVRQRAAYETWDPQEVFDATIRKDLEEKFSYVYPYGYLQDIPAKVSVSELKKQGREEPEEETVYLYAEKEQEPIIPDFMKEEQEPLLQGLQGERYITGSWNAWTTQESTHSRRSRSRLKNCCRKKRSAKRRPKWYVPVRSAGLCVQLWENG